MDNVRLSDSEVYQRWDDGFVVRRMRREESQQVVKWIGADRSVSYDLEVLLEVRGEDADVDGFYIGELNGEAVASLVVAPVVDDVRYLGFLYVVDRLRRSGFARRMIVAARNVERRRNFDGVVCLTTRSCMESMYVKFDYETTARLTRYQGTVSTAVSRSSCKTDVRQVLTAKPFNTSR